ncbi:DNA cytosine methyltransferase [Cupriavidus necator]|uniref:DNA cytosine methyltransferase n=1 Tax=Cupriavidus necator TaxID=106590 RepID=UPI003F509752
MQSTLFDNETESPPVIIVWENVPGVLSDKTNAFGCFLAGLAGEDVELQPAGKRWTNAGCVFGPQRAVAWRTLDAQYFGLAQRRRRVFVVASARDGFDPAQVLLEWDGLRRDSAPSRGARQDTAAGTLRSTEGGSDVDRARASHLIASTGDVSHCLNAGGMGRIDFETETFITQCVTGDVTHALKAEGVDASEDGTGRGNPIVPVAFDTTQITSAANRSNPKPGDPCHPLAAGAHAPAIAFDCKASGQNGFGVGEIASTLRSMGHANSHQNAGGHAAVQQGMAVRRLTPRECERLQGFPDDYTRIPLRRYKARRITKNWPADMWEQVDGGWMLMSADGPRYKALGNSMAKPVMTWIGRRIDAAIRRAAC